jgi:hypothetical protein
LWDNDPAKALPLMICRFLCKSTGRTVSMHPDFSHFYKRYSLSLVLRVLEAVIALGHSIRRTANGAGVSRRSAKRWVQGLTGDNSLSKSLCFFRSAAVSVDRFGSLLLKHFRHTGEGSLERGAAQGMLRLAAEYSCRLY